MEIIDKIKEGSQLHQSLFYNTYKGMLLGYGFRKFDKPQMIEECVHEALCNALLYINSWRGENLEGWLKAVFTNIYLDKIRWDKRLKRKMVVVNNVRVTNEGPKRILKTELLTFIKTLPEGFRKVLILHDYYGYSHREISLKLDIAVGTSKSQLSKAREKIRNDIQNHYKG